MRILSGLKPTGRPHLGNYFGAMRQFVDLQSKGDGYYFIANLHALDGVRNRKEMQEFSLGVALDYLALGLDPSRATLFLQSDIPEVSELMWILGSVTPMGLLLRGHAYKDAVDEGRAVDFGLFAYPVLMAADILLYRSDVVPVGQDQKQHIEVARDLAVKFNQTYCPGFDPQTGEGGALKIPHAMIRDDAGVVPGTDGKKMSKSYGNTIQLFAPDKEIEKSIKRTVTDSKGVDEAKDPSACNVYGMLKLFLTAEERVAVEDRYRTPGTGYGHFKQLLIDKFHEAFDGARARHRELANDPASVREVLRNGAERARVEASKTLRDVQEACGVRW
ncbi:MAG: tryptophan--tRNA ligase [Planctomycetes bacterium]|nr:tryptophan--tRNA ligase [Planctomycetota bacterium]